MERKQGQITCPARKGLETKGDGNVEELRLVLAEALNENLNQIILSNSRDELKATKTKIRPVAIGDRLKFQETRYQGTKVFHENFSAEEMAVRVEKDLTELFRQGEISAEGLEATILVSKRER